MRNAASAGEHMGGKGWAEGGKRLRHNVIGWFR
jgi:hypothetical protein